MHLPNLVARHADICFNLLGGSASGHPGADTGQQGVEPLPPEGFVAQVPGQIVIHRCTHQVGHTLSLIEHPQVPSIGLGMSVRRPRRLPPQPFQSFGYPIACVGHEYEGAGLSNFP